MRQVLRSDVCRLGGRPRLPGLLPYDLNSPSGQGSTEDREEPFLVGVTEMSQVLCQSACQALINQLAVCT